MDSVRAGFRREELKIKALNALATDVVDIPLAAFIGANITTALTMGVGSVAQLGIGSTLALDGVGGAATGTLYRRASGQAPSVGHALQDGAAAASFGWAMRPVAGYLGGLAQRAIGRIGQSGSNSKAGSIVQDLGLESIQNLPNETIIGGFESTYGTAQAFDAVKGWSVGDDIYALTKAGNNPAWSTVRSRFWKNEAANSQNGIWNEVQLDRMQRGLAPQRYNFDKGGIESMDLSHEPIPFREGGRSIVPRWPQDHAAVDPYRRPGY